MEVLSSENYYLSNLYENSLMEEDKRNLGIYYTPKYVIDYIIKQVLSDHDFIKNPYPKILDISCGCGNFLLEVYDFLYEMFEKYKYELNIKDIHNHIISNCIYGIDIDEKAVEVLKYSLKNKDISSTFDKLNIYCFDSLDRDCVNDELKELFWEEKFDYIVGNPPYIGHKKLTINYKKWLIKEYKDVYKDKSDIYFCFYKRIIDLLKAKGIASIITPRYFIESPSGSWLRRYIMENVSIKEIVDFNGINIFKNANIASCIITMSKEKIEKEYINVYKLNNSNLGLKNSKDILSKLNDIHYFDKIILNQKDLDENWIIDKVENIKLYNKIEKNCDYKLKEICLSFQGIITGCDKAFVVEDITRFEEDEILKNWIKSKNIKKYVIKNNSQKLIYSDDIDDLDKYKEFIDYIQKYKGKLENRRECRKNIRKWYQLQWGRDKSLFERKKIMYPYKSSENRFAIDTIERFCSADVYSFYIRPEYEKEFSYEYLVGLLNSDVYDTYFKTFAKKMGKNLYDYYPNKVMEISIFKDHNYKKIESLSKKIINLMQNDDNYNEELINLQCKINDLIIKSLNLNSLT
ncbi:Eco57I restriction-modification methylase domain-containing protein [Paraclostridium sordellii]|uniref:Eco57I restriction-modification methylase domain-containing protein n=1 Tax=Paraclostridium sordellii TaxID=1505 RepID=UPI001C614009|nr:TaqI-like C-terminal specificity domain-containing protein [Paeniclostridium sordellii]QYE97607.1 N-6 DNA methylase [Paeniclostridium sordellii]